MDLTAAPAGPMVSAGWLAAALGAPDLIVFDATLYLPHEGRDARVEFAAGHIPGARVFDVDLMADEAGDLPHMVPTQTRFARLVGALGVSNASRIVFYDQRGIFSAPRGWWLMRLFGHDRAWVLDGGLPKWRADGHPTDSGPPQPGPPAVFRPDFRARRLAGLGDVRAALSDPDALLLDARSAARFRAEAPEPRPGVRAGHVPGAKSLPFTDLLAPDHTLLPAADLRARFGDTQGRSVITYCGSGVTAAVLTLGLAAAGLPEGALYDGSWSEWGSRDDTPIETV